jgi:hypothetical protein
MCEKLYPFEFASLDNARTVVGQATTQRSQPLHFSVSTTTAPLNFAILVTIYNQVTKVIKFYFKRYLMMKISIF